MFVVWRIFFIFAGCKANKTLMRNSLTRSLFLFLFFLTGLSAYSQCCPVKEKVGHRDQFLYDQDDIQMDIFTDNSEDDWLKYTGQYSEPVKWNYNKFVRVRAWSNRSANEDNYIQLYWWIGDGKNPNLTQTYNNKAIDGRICL